VTRRGAEEGDGSIKGIKNCQKPESHPFLQIQTLDVRHDKKKTGFVNPYWDNAQSYTYEVYTARPFVFLFVFLIFPLYFLGFLDARP
jgi:hypothetical protein